MWSSLVAAYSDAVGVKSVTSQTCFFARASRSAWRSGSCLAMASATTVSSRRAPQRASRGAIFSSTHCGSFAGHRVGEPGDLAGLPRRDGEGLDQRPRLRQSVAQVERVGDELHRGGGCDAEGDRQWLGGVGGDLGAAVAAEGLVGEQGREQQGVATPGGHAGLGGRRGAGPPTGARSGASPARPRGPGDRRRRGRRAAPRDRGRRDPARRSALLSWDYSSRGHRHPTGAQEPFVHRGSEVVAAGFETGLRPSSTSGGEVVRPSRASGRTSVVRCRLPQDRDWSLWCLCLAP